MAKNFTILTIFLISLVSPLSADETGKEREKLIQLVLQLETEFGNTLRDYRLLQQDYAKLLERPKVPNQQKKVEQLQKLLDESAKKIHEHQRLEAEAKKGSKAKDEEMAAIRRKVGDELKKLRKSLKEEQSALAVAQVKLSQLKALEDRSKVLEKLYRDETVERSKMMAELKIMRGEKNLLVARVDEFMKRATVAEAAQIKSAERIGQLEEQAGAIKVQLAERDEEIKRLKKEHAGGGAMMAELKKAQGEQKKLGDLLKSRKTEMEKLQGELAAAEKKALDIPVLIRARDDLQGKLTRSEQDYKKLDGDRARLQKELADSNRTLDGSMKKVARLEGDLAKAMKDAVEAVKLGKDVKILTTQRDELSKKLELATKQMLDARKEQEALEVELKKSGELMAAAKKLEQTNKMLMTERDGLKNEQAKLTTELKKLQANTKSMQGELAKTEELAAAAANLGKENKDLEAKRTALTKEVAEGKAAMATLTGKVNTLEAEIAKNKKAVMAANMLAQERNKLAVDLEKAKKDFGAAQVSLKAMEADLAKVAKLGKENKDLTASRDELKKEVATGKAAMAALEVKVKSLEAEMTNNKEAVMSAAKLGEAQKKLMAERDGLKAKLAQSTKELADSRIAAKVMQSEIAKVEEEVAKADKLGKENKELVAFRDALKKEVALGKSTMAALEAKVKSLEAEMIKNKDAAMAAAKSAEAQEKLEKERDDLKAKLANSMADLAKAQNGAKAMQLDLTRATELAAEAAKLGKENKDLVAKRDDLNKEVTASRAAMAALEKKVNGLQADLNKNKETVMAADKLAKEKATLAADLEKAKRDFEGSQTLLKEMSTKVSESMKLAASAKKLGTERDQLSQELKKSEGRLAAAEKSMREAQSKIAENQKMVEASKKLGEENVALAAKSTKLDADLTAAKTALAKAQAEMSAAKAQMGKNTESTTRLTEERNILQKELVSTKTELAKAQLKSKNATELAAQAEQLKKDYALVSARVEALENDKERLGVEVSKKDADLKKLRAEMTTKPVSNEVVAKLESEKKRLGDELAAKTEDLKKVRVDLGRLHLSNASMEKQLNQFRRRLASIDPIRYAKGAADVKDQQTRVLTQVKEVLMLFPEARFEIVGHTCDLGSKAGNLRLSRERAKALFNFLVDEGVPIQRLKSIGMGDSQPAVPNTNETNRRQNRRVEVLILD